jgi:antitoxin component YwqK of YwqJK toxin-antitoxin module
MTQVQVVCEYNDGKDDMRVVMTAKSRHVFAEAARLTDITSKSGEELITALLLFAKGRISKVERYKNNIEGRQINHRHDGVNGEPAIQFIGEDGKVIREMRYAEGQLDDGVRGEPAVLEFDEHGKVLTAVHYKDGLKINPPSKEDKARMDKAKDEFISRAFGNKLNIRKMS